MIGAFANRDRARGRQVEGGVGGVGGDGGAVGAAAEGEGAGGGDIAETGEVGGRGNIGQGQGAEGEIPGMADLEALGAAQQVEIGTQAAHCAITPIRGKRNNRYINRGGEVQAAAGAGWIQIPADAAVGIAMGAAHTAIPTQARELLDW